MQASVEPKDIGNANIIILRESKFLILRIYVAVVTGLGNFSRILGGALGIGKTFEQNLEPAYTSQLNKSLIAVSSAVLNSQLKQELPKILPLNEAMAVIQSSEYVNHMLPKEYLADTLKVYADALRLIWYVLIPMSSMGFISSFFVKHHSTRRPEPKKEVVVEEEVKTKDEPVVLEILAPNDEPVLEENKDRQSVEVSSSKILEEHANKKTETL